MARLITWNPLDEWDPNGRVHAPRLAEGLVSRYDFVKKPEKLEDWNVEKGIDFVYGRFKNVEISKLSFFRNGIVVDTRSSTDDSEAVFADIREWAVSEFGIEDNPDAGKNYVSELTFHSDLNLGALNAVMAVVASQLTQATRTDPIGVTYEPFGIAFSFDETLFKGRTGQFRLERRVGAPFSDKKYFSSAPLRTAEHLELLATLEAALT